MTVIATTKSATSTGYSNQRKLDRTSNGVLHTLVQRELPGETGSVGFTPAYSTDNGATWTSFSNGPYLMASSTPINYTVNYSFFIDEDDYWHLVYKSPGTGSVYYLRLTPNAARTSWTWGAATMVWAGTTMDYPDVVAFRSPHNTGTWHVCIVAGYLSGSANYAGYARLDIASNGTVGAVQRDNLPVLLSQDGMLGGNYGIGLHVFPSIDFNHTGNGKTVAGATPHIYTAWSAGTTGSGKGIRFRKATYAASAWSWGTEREIDTSVYWASANSDWLNCLFDGTRVVLCGNLYDGAGHRDIILHDRDVADTVTTSRKLFTDASATNLLYAGAASYDSSGNIYLFGSDSSGADGTRLLNSRKWTRASSTLGAITTIDSTAKTSAYVSVKRGNSTKRIEYIYTDGTTSPYSLAYEKIILNDPPTVTISPAAGTKVDPRVNNSYSWTYSDTDSDPQVSFSASVHEPSVATTWVSGASAQTGTVDTFTAPYAGVYTIEAIGAVGGKSSGNVAGGKGARVVGDFALTAGEQISVIAGKPGGNSTQSYGGGGGGASWVYKVGAAQPMLVAGGGGGGGDYSYEEIIQDASITTTGKTGRAGQSATGGAGGTGGNGGASSSYGSGGAGWLTNGADGSSSTGGKTPANGAGGGNPYTTGYGAGGFGGGGGTYAGAGGGGGYSGGGGGGWSSSGNAGGGGSYNAGTNQIMTEGYNTGEGSVTITINGAVVYSTSGTTGNSITVPANSMLDEKTYYLTLTVSDGYNTVVKDHSITSNSWIEDAPVTSSAQSITRALSHGSGIEAQVATSDANGFGPWSPVASYMNNIAPTVSVNAPVAATTTNAKVNWTYSDADGDPQTRYQIRIRKKI